MRGQVKFIKFFAWEDRWIQRVMEARKVEMEWMVKGAFISSRIVGTCAGAEGLAQRA